MPTLDDRKDIITRVTSGMAVDSDVDASDLAKETDYCTGADLDYLFR
jgi:ATP-dependent 26S proteasome regulatory subunit